MELCTLYAVRRPNGHYYADSDEHAVLAPANADTAEAVRQRAAKLWGVAPDELVVERFDRIARGRRPAKPVKPACRPSRLTLAAVWLAAALWLAVMGVCSCAWGQTSDDGE